ncbi:hypothetical protein [Fusibacter tunisiensis]|uniref:Uncharacterized protein n=1 Tax=Fusibacter tunisiensis TaxID=1008308 RepID=A0ABS2MQV4_9FIRM|nr:hypothetical protein [Fusibacter tunisiensis]MBM7561775.1 hypothetical protein [Fusibacter tunisiensis]
MNPKYIKYWIGLTLVLCVILGIKSFFIDPVKLDSPEKKEIVEQMQVIIDEQYDHSIFTTGIVKVRIIEVKADGPDNFKGHYRKYLLGIFPIGDTYFSSKEDMEGL